MAAEMNVDEYAPFFTVKELRGKIKKERLQNIRIFFVKRRIIAIVSSLASLEGGIMVPNLIVLYNEIDKIHMNCFKSVF